MIQQDFYIIVGNKLRMYREDAGIKPTAFCQELVDYNIFFSDRQLRRYESGDSPIPLYTLAACANVLNIELTDLLPNIEHFKTV